MKYIIEKDCIKVYSKDDFCPKHILECGQVFCYKKEGDVYKVYPEDNYAEIEEFDDFYMIKTSNPHYFVDFFDLNNDYTQIKKSLSEYKIMANPLKFGHGIRILNQDLFETMISFIISSNNNIKRIMLILNNLRENLGEKIEEGIYSFPSYQKLLECDEEFFKRMGAGYRASYLYKVLRQITPEELTNLASLSTSELRNKLIALSGVGPKVADCLLLFGFHKGDVFPVDTWIHQMYNSYFNPIDNREVIRKNLVDKFGELSGYAQQYLFYFQRSFEQKQN